MALKQDFEFITSLTSEFLQRAHIKKTLKAINDCEMSGWEKWLQIELSAFLETRDDIRAWWRESSYEIDKRVAESRKSCAVDFLIHQKWKQSHMALELKQVNSPTACIQGMIKDKKKIETIKTAKYDIRSVWCLGVHRAIESDEVKRLAAYYGSKLKSPVNSKLLVTERIGYSPYMFTVF